MKLRIPTINDKENIENYVEEHYKNNEHEIHGSNLLDKLDFEEWIDRLDRIRTYPEELWGISDTFIAVNENNKIIGMVNIRYNPVEEIALKYGHIGYSVCPSERRKGIATQILKEALEICKKHGLKEVIMGCRKDNIGSAKTIIKNGGVLIREEDNDGEINQYYIINLS